MSNNLFLYDFNGSIRRNKLQEAMFRDLAQKEEFMKRVASERAERQLSSKKKSAAVKIQSAFRSYCVRKKCYAYLRETFDAAGPANKQEMLEAQISHLAFFFNRTHDITRTISLCNDAVLLSRQIRDSLHPLRRHQLLSCAVGVLGEVTGDVSYVPILRYIEVFLNERDCTSESFCTTYFASVISLFINHFNLPDPIEARDYLPPRGDAILRFLLLPCRFISADKRPRLYYQLLLSISVSKSEMHAVCYLVPFLCKVVKSGEVQFPEIIMPFADETLFGGFDTSQIVFLAYILSSLTGAASLDGLSVDSKSSLLKAFGYFIKCISPASETIYVPLTAELDSDDEEIPTVNIDAHAEDHRIGSCGFYMHSISSALSADALRQSFVDSTLQSDENCARLAVIIHFLHDFDTSAFTAFLNALSLHRTFISRLWHHVTSLRGISVSGSSQTLLNMLEKGDCVTDGDESLLLPMLSLFVTLFSNMLTTADDDDFLNGGQPSSLIPFSIKEIACIAASFRDLTLGLIDVAFPVTPGALHSSFVQSAVKNSKWSDIFKRVTSLTKMLYERDCRLQFMPSNFWSNHNRQVVVSSSLWRVGRRRRRTRGRPFEFVRLMIRERQTDEEEEPPSPIELRNISILLSIPFVLPFMQRVEMFNEVVARDKAMAGFDTYHREAYHFTVHRETIYEDAFSALTPAKAPDLRNVLRVQMVNWAGLNEAGVDGGGIFREFMSELLKTVVDPARGFFTTTHDQMLYPNPVAMSLYPDFHDHFYFIGRIIAKLIYEGLLADLRFADFFISQCLGTSGIGTLDLEYVKSYDPLVHANLKYLKYCSPNEVDALDLDFSVLVDNLGATEKVSLKKGGDEIKVTAENRSEYIALYVNFFLSKRIAPMLNSFRAGVRSVIDVEWLRMFSPAEISILIGGVDSEINFEDLRKFTAVHNVQSDEDKAYVDMFWMVLTTLPSPDKKKFLKFVTGCSRPPLMGFKALNPPMGIQLIHQEPERLPTAATCMNLLKLPVYPEYDYLRSKLLFAINSGAGFELS